MRAKGFRLSKVQTQGLANALRICTWADLPGGDVTISLVEPKTGNEVDITLWSAKPVEQKRPIGFRME